MRTYNERMRRLLLSFSPLVVLSGMWLSAFSAATSQSLESGATFPSLQGQTLDDHDIVLPDIVHGRVCLVIMTFSKEAGERSRQWQDRFVKDHPAQAGAAELVTSYSIAMISDAPRFVRGMIRSAMRHGTPQPLHARTATVATDSSPWKRRLNASNDKDVYLLLLNKQGHIAWMHHGDFDPIKYSELNALAERLAK